MLVITLHISQVTGLNLNLILTKVDLTSKISVRLPYTLNEVLILIILQEEYKIPEIKLEIAKIP